MNRHIRFLVSVASILGIFFVYAIEARAEDRALVIGNSNYPTLNDLPGASVDADNMAAILSGAGYQVTKLKDQSAQNILDAIAATKPNDPNCCFIIYYAGHGDNTVPAQGALIGTDETNVTPAQLSTAVDSCRERTLVILDSCGSGGFAMTAQDVNNCPGFLTAVDNATDCASKTGAGGTFTNAILACLNDPLGGARTVQALSTWLANTYDVTEPVNHFYNGKLPNKVLSAVEAIPAVSNVGLMALLLLTAVAGVIVIRRARRGHATA